MVSCQVLMTTTQSRSMFECTKYWYLSVHHFQTLFHLGHNCWLKSSQVFVPKLLQ